MGNLGLENHAAFGQLISERITRPLGQIGSRRLWAAQFVCVGFAFILWRALTLLARKSGQQPTAPPHPNVFIFIVDGYGDSSVESQPKIGGASSKLQELKDLKELLDSGAINDNDYEKLKKEILNG